MHSLLFFLHQSDGRLGSKATMHTDDIFTYDKLVAEEKANLEEGMRRMKLEAPISKQIRMFPPKYEPWRSGKILPTGPLRGKVQTFRAFEFRIWDIVFLI